MAFFNRFLRQYDSKVEFVSSNSRAGRALFRPTLVAMALGLSGPHYWNEEAVGCGALCAAPPDEAIWKRATSGTIQSADRSRSAA
jgi:hypothetical protein